MVRISMCGIKIDKLFLRVDFIQMSLWKTVSSITFQKSTFSSAYRCKAPV